jgi:hypothetical protein
MRHWSLRNGQDHLADQQTRTKPQYFLHGPISSLLAASLKTTIGAGERHGLTDSYPSTMTAGPAPWARLVPS